MDQPGVRPGLTVPQVEHKNEAEWPDGCWLGWDAWVSTPTANGRDEH